MSFGSLMNLNHYRKHTDNLKMKKIILRLLLLLFISSCIAFGYQLDDSSIAQFWDIFRTLSLIHLLCYIILRHSLCKFNYLFPNLNIWFIVQCRGMYPFKIRLKFPSLQILWEPLDVMQKWLPKAWISPLHIYILNQSRARGSTF